MGGPFDTYFLEADAITGPYRMITYMPAFGPAAYFGNIPVRKTPRFSPFYTKHDHFYQDRLEHWESSKRRGVLCRANLSPTRPRPTSRAGRYWSAICRTHSGGSCPASRLGAQIHLDRAVSATNLPLLLTLQDEMAFAEA